MKFVGKLLLVTSVAMLALSWTGRASAQSCGYYCGDCFHGKSGIVGTSWWYSTKCFPGTDCSFCTVSTQEGSTEAVGILSEFTQVPPELLPAVLEKYRNNVVLDEERNLLVVAGNDCDTASIPAAVFVQPERTRILQKLGVPSLRRYLLNHPLPVSKESTTGPPSR